MIFSLVFILAFAVDKMAGFCTQYAPLDGSTFVFPRKQCLTEDFMNAQFEADVFQLERIPLAQTLRNLQYGDVSMPLVLEASLGWESGHMVSAVVDILLREVLGVNTEFICTWGSVHAMKLLGGCENPMDALTPCVVNGSAQVDPPLAHVSVESWVTTPAEHDEMNTYNIDLGMLGYYSKSGLFFDEKIAVDAFEQEHLTLEWWQGFADVPAVANYFDDYAAIADDVQQWSGGSVAPRCRPGDSGHDEMARLGMHCEDGWYFSPACAEDKSSCIPVVLAEYDWNGLVWMNAVRQHGYRFAVTWLGAQHSLTYSMRTPKRLMFYCATTSALCHEKPIVKMFADNHMPIGRPDLITSLRKVIWRKLPQVNEQVHEFLTRVNIPTADINALMAAYSNEIRPGLQDPRDIDTFVPDIACRWLRNEIEVLNNAGTTTGLNSAKWVRWLPRTCNPGEEFDKVSGSCRSCQQGYYSSDGRKCIPCGAGTFADELALSNCKLCRPGSWQEETGSDFCNDCPVGWHRGATDQGCQKCRPGFFTDEEGSEDCVRCPAGSWSEEMASNTCEKCPSTLTTKSEASTSATACQCLAGDYWPCLDDCEAGVLSPRAHETLQCQLCPTGMTCNGGILRVNVSTEHAQPLVNDGYYALETAPYEAYECFQAGAQCVGGEVSKCAGGRHGMQCHACPQGLRAAPGGECVDCGASGQNAILPLAFIGGSFALMLVYKLSTGKQEKAPSKTAMLGMLSILLINTQMFSIVVSFSVGWTTSFRHTFQWMEIFAFDLDTMTSSSCHFGHTSMGPKYLPGLFLPVVITGMMIIFWGASQILSRFSSRFEAMKMDQSINALGMVLMSLYISVCKAVFNIFECRTNPSAPKTLRSHDGFLCFGEGVQGMIPAAVLGALFYVGIFSSVYLWVIVKAPSKYQDSESFRLRTHFLLSKWHPEKWFWGILFVTRNLICSLIPSLTTDGSVQILAMFLVMFGYFLASATCSPWRDELSNTHDLIMVGALLMTLVVAQALQVQVLNGGSMGPAWFSVLEAASSLLFLGAALVCCGVLLQHVLKEFVLYWEKKALDSENLPNLMKSASGEGSKGLGDMSVSVDGSKKLRKRISLASADEKVNSIYTTLSGLSTWKGDDTLLDIVKQLEEELPTSDLRRLQWGMGIISYHILGDHTRKPSGIVLSPAASRNSCASTRVRPSEVLAGEVKEELAEV